MDPKRPELHSKQAELHGKRRRLHEGLSEVCEEFVLSDLTKEHKQKKPSERITVFARRLQG